MNGCFRGGIAMANAKPTNLLLAFHASSNINTANKCHIRQLEKRHLPKEGRKSLEAGLESFLRKDGLPGKGSSLEKWDLVERVARKSSHGTVCAHWMKGATV
jgi:hypothetical protein